MPPDIKKNVILDRIQSLEDNLSKAQDYLETGKQAHWHGFRPGFKEKNKDGKFVPAHKDWVRSVFIPCRERAIKKAEKILDNLE